jgi:hypothetical protein
LKLARKLAEQHEGPCGVKPDKRGKCSTIAGGAIKNLPAKEKTLEDCGVDSE